MLGLRPGPDRAGVLAGEQQGGRGPDLPALHREGAQGTAAAPVVVGPSALVCPAAPKTTHDPCRFPATMGGMKRKHRLRQRRLPGPPTSLPLWRVALWVALFGTDMEWALMVGLMELRLTRIVLSWAALNEPFIGGAR